MAHHSNADDGQVSGINVTPLVDITLDLLKQAGITKIAFGAP